MASYSYFLTLILIVISAILLLHNGHTLAAMVFAPSTAIALMLCDSLCNAIRRGRDRQ